MSEVEASHSAENRSDESHSEHSDGRVWPWTGTALIVFLILGIVGYSGFARARRHGRMKTCQENLTKIWGAKEQWALENNKTLGDTIPDSDSTKGSDFYGRSRMPSCPSGGGTYLVNPIGTDPVCTSGLPGHNLSPVGVAITQMVE